MHDFKQLRKQKGLTQSDVAEKLGISQQAYAKYESGQYPKNEEILNKLHELFGISGSNGYLSQGCGKNASIEDFLETSYTAYQSVNNAVSMLDDFGFERVSNENSTFREGISETISACSFNSFWSFKIIKFLFLFFC